MRVVWWLPGLLLVMLLALCFKGLYVNQRILSSPLIGSKMISYELKTLNGKVINLNKIKGPYVLNIFASWCPACKYEHSFWNRNSSYKIIGLAYKDQILDVNDWLGLYGNPYHIVALDPKGDFAIELGVYGTPETFLVNKLGKIVYRHVGPMSKSVWQHNFLPVLAA